MATTHHPLGAPEPPILDDTPPLDQPTLASLEPADSSSPAPPACPQPLNPPSPTQATALEKLDVVAAATTTTTTTTSDSAESPDYVAMALQFLSTATPEALCAVGAGLVVLTYFLLGQLGLVLIGAFGGVVLFVSYQAKNPDLMRSLRGERGVDVLERLGLQLEQLKGQRSLGQDGDEKEVAGGDNSVRFHDFDDFGPETRDALGALVDAIIRDYVKWWYTPLVPADSSFPLSCRKLLTSFLLSVSNHLGRKRPADAFLDFLTNASSILIVFLSELSAAFAELPSSGGDGSNLTAAETVQRYLAEHPNSALANLLNREQQEAKFRMVSEDLLAYLDRSAHRCDPARAFLREITAGVILEMTLQKCSQPDWINSWIVYLLEAGEPDISQAIDVGISSDPDPNSHAFIDLDGNVGNMNIAKPANKRKTELAQEVSHQRKGSKAKEEMDEAMEQMRRMNAMIAEEEEARRARETEQELLGATSASPEPPSRRYSRNDVLLGGHSREQSTSFSPGELSPRTRLTFDKQATTTTTNAKPASEGSTDRSDAQDTPTSSLSETTQNRASSPPAAAATAAATAATGMFTSFDQIVPPGRDSETDDHVTKPPLTLHNATITIYDDVPPNDKGRMRSKPTWDYLIQIEPAASIYPGWMIARKYSDFETLHEILRRIATISGATAFAEQHTTLAGWKVHTRASLRGELERYLRDACWFPSLADSEGMKRFLDRDQGQPQSAKQGLDWENVGKGMLDVLTIAPKGAMAGGKAVVGGVTGVFGNIGLGRKNNNVGGGGGAGQQQHQQRQSIDTQGQAAAAAAAAAATMQNSRASMSSPTPLRDSNAAAVAPATSSSSSTREGWRSRDSMDSQRSSSVVSTQPGRVAPMDRRASKQSVVEIDSDVWRPLSSVAGSREPSRPSSRAAGPLRSSPSALSIEGMRLPPPPDEMPADFDSSSVGGYVALKAGDEEEEEDEGEGVSQRNSVHSLLQQQQPQQPPTTRETTETRASQTLGSKDKKSPPRKHAPLEEGETRVAVELMFAVINELYTLSSAWTFRRTLLAAAKSFLLRPGNPSLTSIQKLVQETVLDGSTTDAAVAGQLRTLRAGALPTEEERASWPTSSVGEEERERQRAKARRLLVGSGVPAALMGVMGAGATSEAVGRVFDSLQEEGVARGLVFGVMLQAVRVITH